MKKLLMILFVLLVVSSCGTADKERTYNDALEIVSNFEGFQVVKFVVSANCDYDYFFEYAPMRNGGFFAYGYQNNQPKILTIPKYDSHEAKLMNWPLLYTLSDIADLINEAYDTDKLTEENLYNHVRFELTYSVLKLNETVDYDHGFFVIFTIDNVRHIAIQNNNQLFIYHEHDGLLISND